MNARTNTLGGSHVERILAIRSGEWVRISCDCAIGTDHTYAEWLELFGVPAPPVTP
jgi:hypothetical protein